MLLNNLKPSTTPGSSIKENKDGIVRLSIPVGPAGQYRLAQLDDYHGIPRNKLPWLQPFSISLQLRASSQDISGTWGFGLWNDPFGISLGLKGGQRKIPALPQTAWYFNASKQNYLTLFEELPANGLFAGVTHSRKIPPPLFLLSVPTLPLFAWPPTARYLRRLMRRVIKQDAISLIINPTDWHTYSFEWHNQQAKFILDGVTVLKTSLNSSTRMGLVIWIDNQYAAFPPDGHITYGSLSSDVEQWLDIKSLVMDPKP